MGKLLSSYTNTNGEEKGYSNLLSLSRDLQAKRQLAQDLEKYYYLSYNTDNGKHYLFDYDKLQYESMDEKTLQAFLYENEGIRLNTNDTNALLKEIIKRTSNDHNYVEFNNKFLNLNNCDVESKTMTIKIDGKDVGTQKPSKHTITPRKVNYNLLENTKEDFNSDDSILYKTLHQILGTEQNVKDFKQRIGSMIFNKGKEITIYYNSKGNNGKTILLYIIKLVLGTLGTNTAPGQLKSEFKQNLLDNKHAILFDETNGSSFKDTEDILKKITGGGIGEESRKIQTDEIITTNINAHVCIATNELPDFNLNDRALFKRITIIKLPNRFTYLDTEIDNEKIFPINENIQVELMEDIKGIEHFIYESIREYRSMKDEGAIFTNKKGIEHTISSYLGNDIIVNFLSVYTELTETESENTTNLEILNNFKQYIKDNNLNYGLDDVKISKEIGMKLNRVHGRSNIVRERNKDLRLYKNIKCNYSTGTEIKYNINPDLEDYEIISTADKKIFNLIKKGYNTFELLKQQNNDHDNILRALEYLKEGMFIEEEHIIQIT